MIGFRIWMTICFCFECLDYIYTLDITYTLIDSCRKDTFSIPDGHWRHATRDWRVGLSCSYAPPLCRACMTVLSDWRRSTRSAQEEDSWSVRVLSVKWRHPRIDEIYTNRLTFKETDDKCWDNASIGWHLRYSPLNWLLLNQQGCENKVIAILDVGVVRHETRCLLKQLMYLYFRYHGRRGC